MSGLYIPSENDNTAGDDLQDGKLVKALVVFRQGTHTDA